MKLSIENISSEDDFSWRFAKFDWKTRSADSKRDVKCSGWHYHNEYELVLYQDPDSLFSGNIFAGDFIGEPSHNTMLLYGPGLPHMIMGKVNPDSQRGIETYILWFSPAWVERVIETIPALTTLKPMLGKSSKGLGFSPACVNKVAQLMVQNPSQQSPARQFSVLVDILLLLAEDKESKALTSIQYGYSEAGASDGHADRVELARTYIENHYQQRIQIADLCRHLHMSESSVYRLFERNFSESFAEHLKNFRVGKACEMLIQSQKPVSWVAQNAGFANLSNFNRHFKETKGMTPSNFRKAFSLS
ncbi:AraC family transcriptional regulator [Veronia nyctiphanis]|uniref:AraC family transcriptional regulator n=1 Tax=Veronia nyctiphanis TaxID=1278244 RepID=A0A4Q0YRE3_9GAMM|nr:AraC family transcriptional regulator [Veronia nyctiphanis]RXJ71669.1 AraC family transcriptional regulator [Veronia nyctiphanis]